MRRYAQVTIRKYIFKDEYVTIYIHIHARMNTNKGEKTLIAEIIDTVSE